LTDSIYCNDIYSKRSKMIQKEKSERTKKCIDAYLQKKKTIELKI